MSAEAIMRCSRRGCGWVGTEAEYNWVAKAKDPRFTQGRCPRCGCDSFYKTKAGEVSTPLHKSLPAVRLKRIAEIMDAVMSEARQHMITEAELVEIHILAKGGQA